MTLAKKTLPPTTQMLGMPRSSAQWKLPILIAKTSREVHALMPGKRRVTGSRGWGVVVVGCWKGLQSPRADKPCFIHSGQRSPVRQLAKAYFGPHGPHPGRHKHTYLFTERQTDIGMLAEMGQRLGWRPLTSRLYLYRTTQKWQSVKKSVI